MLLLQWSVITFDEMTWAGANSPSLWVNGKYTVSPATGATDSRGLDWTRCAGYGGQPGWRRRVAGDARRYLGEILYRGKLRYLVTLDELNVVVNVLTEYDESGWGQYICESLDSAERWRRS